MNMKGMRFQYTIPAFLCMISLLVIAAPVYPANEFKLKAGAKGELCLKCHETFQKTLKSRYLHPLVKMGDCSGCHDPHTSSYKNLLIAEPTKLCYNCHKDVLPENARSAHRVVVEADCNKCHDSHGSDNKFILIKSGNDLCFGCHKDMMDSLRNVRFKHEPVGKDKGCINCHNPHASAKLPFLLQKDVPSLCLTCHKTGDPSFKKQHMNYPVAKSNCSSCHNSHGSNKKGILFEVAHAPLAEKKCTACHEEPTARNPLKTKSQGAALCRECHKDMMADVFKKKQVHWALVDRTGCLNCHNPHATAEKKLLKGSISNVCGTCHSDTVELQTLSRNNPKNEHLCEPVKSGNCIQCHSPHSSDNVLLFARAPVNQALCGACHEWETHSTHPIGDKVVDQRNKNLTVNCLSCHRACGTANNPSMLQFDTTYDTCIQCHKELRR